MESTARPTSPDARGERPILRDDRDRQKRCDHSDGEITMKIAR